MTKFAFFHFVYYKPHTVLFVNEVRRVLDLIATEFSLLF